MNSCKMEIKYFSASFNKGQQNGLRKLKRNSTVKQFFQGNKIIQEKLKQIINISDVQQGFETRRSCIDVVFKVKHKQKKLWNLLNQHTYFVDLENAFENLDLWDNLNV